MKQIWNWIKNNPNRAMFLIPILLVAGISISHVITWYELSNPINWAIYLSIAIEVGAITALIAATNKIKGGVWFMFLLVTFIQMVGNIFYSYKEIDENGDLFKSWVELTGPIWELMGTETTDIVGIKRWLSFLTGGLLPIISLTSLHYFVKYEKPETNEKPTSVKNTQVESERVWEKVRELKKEGKLSEPTKEDIVNEPTALANSQYRNEIEENSLDDEQPNLVEEENPEDEVLYHQPILEEKISEETFEIITYCILSNEINVSYADKRFKASTVPLTI
jgi:hypothetical protein